MRRGAVRIQGLGRMSLPEGLGRHDCLVHRQVALPSSESESLSTRWRGASLRGGMRCAVALDTLTDTERCDEAPRNDLQFEQPACEWSLEVPTCDALPCGALTYDALSRNASL